MNNERSAAVSIGGQSHEMLLTTRATKEIAKRYGGLSSRTEESRVGEEGED